MEDETATSPRGVGSVNQVGGPLDPKDGASILRREPVGGLSRLNRLHHHPINAGERVNGTDC
jgi:hypothetical protein